MHVKKVQAKQEGSDLLDLLGKKYTYEEKSLKISTADIDGHYQERKKFLERAYNESEKFIENFFKKAA